MLLGVFPALGATILGAEKFHEMLLWAVVPMTAISLGIGCKKHKSVSTVLLGIVGLAVLIVTAMLGHDGLSETSERILTLIGATIIAIAHIRNYQLCRNAICRCDALGKRDNDSGKKV